MKKKYAKKEDIPAEDVKHYVEKGGAWVLKLEDEDDEDDDREFRQRNIQQRKKIDELEKMLEAKDKEFEGVKPDDFRKAMSVIEQMKSDEEKQLIREGKFEDVITRRTATAISSKDNEMKQLRKSLEAAEKKAETMGSKLGQLTIGNQIQLELGAQGVRVRPGALEDVLQRTSRVWTLDETGNPRARMDGQDLYGEDTKPITMGEFAKTFLVAKAPHLFEAAQGGGAGGGKKDDEQGTGNAKRIRRGDQEGFSNNLEDIAKGKVVVAGD